jgi:hypothetical protein
MIVQAQHQERNAHMLCTSEPKRLLRQQGINKGLPAVAAAAATRNDSTTSTNGPATLP